MIERLQGIITHSHWDGPPGPDPDFTPGYRTSGYTRGTNSIGGCRKDPHTRGAVSESEVHQRTEDTWPVTNHIFDPHRLVDGDQLKAYRAFKKNINRERRNMDVQKPVDAAWFYRMQNNFMELDDESYLEVQYRRMMAHDAHKEITTAWGNYGPHTLRLIEYILADRKDFDWSEDDLEIIREKMAV
ncbi:hypothetical protein Ddye_024068 [Dipteronia dyeriana]|uniref:Uncharacterized protein n=1 Tax=Dipteronia dyeriana TaxID=168575 RepID=A0AAD9TU39_9ROSI|nr:hypothetical protein Ddye_024068 [Dipteronia dyeriana]